MTEINLEQAQALMNEHNAETFSWAFKHIKYEEKIGKAKKELLNTNPRKIIKWGWKVWDTLLWGIYGWKVYVIWAESWSGKSTFVNQIAMSLSKQNIKTTKYALEDRLEDIWKEELFYISNRIAKSNWVWMFEWNAFNNNEYFHKEWKFYQPKHLQILEKAEDSLKRMRITELEKTKQVKIDDLVKLMAEEAERGTKVFIIDHLHYFKMSWEKRTDLEIQNIMHDINEVARKHNVAVFLVAHYKKLDWKKPNNDSFKDASAIKQVANYVIHIIRDWTTDRTEFRLGKIRWPIKKASIEAEFDIETYQYTGFILLEN